MPGGGSPASNTRSPRWYCRRSPKRAMRAISDSVSLGKACSWRPTMLLVKGETGWRLSIPTCRPIPNQCDDNLFHCRFDDVDILLRRPSAHADACDHLALAGQRYSAAHRRVAASRDHDERIQRLARLHQRHEVGRAQAHERGRVGLALRQLEREQRRSWHAVLQDDVAVNVDHADRHRHLGLRRLRLDALRDVLRECQQIHESEFLPNVAMVRNDVSLSRPRGGHAPSCPTENPNRFSTAPGFWKPRSKSARIRCCAAARVIDVMQASHPAAISTSGGRLAAFTRRFVLVLAHLSNEAMRVASASTKSSSAASGNERFT